MSLLTYVGINTGLTLGGLAYAQWRNRTYPTLAVYGCFLVNSALYLAH